MTEKKDDVKVVPDKPFTPPQTPAEAQKEKEKEAKLKVLDEKEKAAEDALFNLKQEASLKKAAEDNKIDVKTMVKV